MKIGAIKNRKELKVLILNNVGVGFLFLLGQDPTYSLDKQGTMYQNFVVGFQTELYKQRAMELERLYEVVILK